MTIEEAYKSARKAFSHLENGELEARWLVTETAGLNEISLWSEPQLKIPQEITARITERVERRKNGEPMAYVLGFKDFFRSRFFISSSVLIPRPETELIVTEILKKALNAPNEPYEICDIGTGSGCIGLSLLKELYQARLTAIDISPTAIEIAKKNAVQLNLDNRATFINESARPSVFEGRQFDFVVSNPPYIAPHDKEVAVDVHTYEPHSALYADANGLRFIEEWLGYAAQSLKSGGVFAFEIGRGQAEEVKKIVERLKVFSHIEMKKDLQGIERVIVGERK
ncbi:MAG: peptide chain release factor N(5)-glutamine methyltransferase [Bdellovibrionota bacterium]